MKKVIFWAVKVSDHKKDIKNKYDETAKFYNKRYLEIQEEKIKELLINKSNLGNFLDLGCGTCILKGFLPDFNQYVGVDFSLNMLKNAKSTHGNLNLIQADVEYLPFRKGIFETINVITVIQNLLTLEKLFSEIDRVSKDTYHLFVSILKKDKLLPEFEEYLKKNQYHLIDKIDNDKIEDILFNIKKEK